MTSRMSQGGGIKNGNNKNGTSRDKPSSINNICDRGLEKPEWVKKKLKIALEILLFQGGSISLGKATELTEMSREIYGCFKGTLHTCL